MLVAMMVSGSLAEAACLTLKAVALLEPFQLNTTCALPGVAMKLEIAGSAKIAGDADASTAPDSKIEMLFVLDRLQRRPRRSHLYGLGVWSSRNWKSA